MDPASPYGAQSMIAPLKRVMVRAPDAAFGNADPLRWHYTSQPRLEGARREHAAFVELLTQAGAEVIRHDEPLPDHADAIFCHDPVLVTHQGAILLRMGKALRRGEEEAAGEALERAGVPVHARLRGDALAEAGDCLWLDEATLAVGLGFRTNLTGLTQLREALGSGVQVIPVELPYYTGPDACLHLMSLISLVDHDLAVAYPPLMPVPFWELLRQRGIRLLPIPEREFPTLGTNVLALGPGKCLMLAGNPETESMLRQAGCEVLTCRGEELSLKAEGGPTCLTRPVWRA